LLNGWDEVGLTLSHKAEIEKFRLAQRETAPWLFTRG